MRERGGDRRASTTFTVTSCRIVGPFVRFKLAGASSSGRGRLRFVVDFEFVLSSV